MLGFLAARERRIRVAGEKVLDSRKIVEAEDRPVKVLTMRAPHGLRDRVGEWLKTSIFVALCLVALLAMNHTIAARWAFEAALVLWVGRLLVVGRNYEPQPFVAPALAFLVCVGIAACLSYAPLLSWQRIGWFVACVLPLIVAQNLRTMRQVKVLVLLVLLAGALSALQTGWQYVYGVGTELVNIPANSALLHDGVQPHDFVQRINEYRTRTSGQWRKALERTASDRTVWLHIARGTPVTYFDVQVKRADLQRWLDTPGSLVRRAHPIRAQGRLYHYMPYAGVLLQVALLTFGLMIAGKEWSWAWRVGMAVLFIALTAALAATLTRIYLAALIGACFVQFWLLFKKLRLLAVLAVALALAGTTFLIQQERGLGWLALADPGTEYRVMMWKDALRLIPAHPLFGVGPDSVLQEGARWNVRAYKEFGVTSHFHSTYIELAVDCGILSLGAWLWLMGSYAIWLARTWKRAKAWDGFSRGLLLGVAGGVIGFLMAGFVQYTLGDGEVMMLVWLFMGLLIASARMHENQPPEIGAQFVGHRNGLPENP